MRSDLLRNTASFVVFSALEAFLNLLIKALIGILYISMFFVKSKVFLLQCVCKQYGKVTRWEEGGLVGVAKHKQRQIIRMTLQIKATQLTRKKREI